MCQVDETSIKMVEQQRNDFERLKVDLHSSTEQTNSMRLRLDDLTNQLTSEQQKNKELSTRLDRANTELQETRSQLEVKSAVR